MWLLVLAVPRCSAVGPPCNFLPCLSLCLRQITTIFGGIVLQKIGGKDEVRRLSAR
jgi:hypothetical protein